MCDNCNIINERIITLNNEITSIEERRSRERSRHIEAVQHANSSILDHGDLISKSDCETCLQLVELVTHLIRENPNMIGLDEIKRRLEYFKF